MRKENRCFSLRILEKAQEAFCRLTNSRLIASVRSLIDDHHAIQASVSLHTIEQNYYPRKSNAQWLRGSEKLFSSKLLGLWRQKLKLRKMVTEISLHRASQNSFLFRYS